VSWGNVLIGSVGNSVSFSTSQVILEQMQVHLITIKVSIIGTAVSIMVSDGVFFGQNSGNMTHN